MKAFLFFSLITLSASATEVLTNFSFETGQNPWSKVSYTGKYNSDPTGGSIPVDATLPGLDFTAVGWYDPLLPVPNPLPKAVRVSGRRWHTDGLRQNVWSSLPTSPNPAGEPYRFKLKIKAEDACFVRCLFTFTNATSPDVPLIVAEKVIRTAQVGQWVEIVGVRNIIWPTTYTPTQARVSLDVGQIYKEKLNGTPTAMIPNPTPIYLPYPSGKWPSYTLDFISMDRDGDLDGLSDAEEMALVPPSLANNADSDSDGLPDRWEKDNNLLWSVADSSADKDLDGFTNAEEYWAATDPSVAASYPGKTANINATAATKAVAKMLALVPSKGKRLVGQTVNDASSEYQADVVALANLVQTETGTAHWPAIMSLTLEGVAVPVNITGIMPFAQSYLASGHLVVIKWAMWNPWTGGSVGSQGTLGQVDIPALVDPTSPNYNLAANVTARTTWLGWLDTVATEVAKLVDPAFGGHPDHVLIFRPMSEMTGDWDWFGHRTYDEYNALWHFIYNRFTNEKHLNHLLWCHESAQSEHHFLTASSKPVPADYYYPGDDEVDIMGHNFYDNDWVLPNDLNAVFRSYPKIYAFPQAGADTEKIGPVYFDNLNYPNRIAASFPRASFFIPWSTYTINGGNTTVHHAIISNPNASAMMTDSRIISDSWMTPWQQWAHNNLGTLTAPMEGDTDHDGSSDALEYALGTAALSSTQQAFTVIQGAANTPLGLTFTRNLSATDATFTMEGSTDLSTWLPVAQATGPGAWSVLAGGSITQAVDGTVTFIDNVMPGAGARRFLRLGVVVP